MRQGLLLPAVLATVRRFGWKVPALWQMIAQAALGKLVGV